MRWDDFEKAFAPLAAEHGLVWRSLESAIVVDYSDGCDVLVVEKPAIAALPPLMTPAEAAAKYVAEFRRIDAARTNVLVALRHCAKDQKIAVTKSADGIWGLESANGCANSINVGSRLTAMLARHEVPAAFAAVIKDSLLRVPSSRRIERLLSRTEPPAEELCYDDDAPSEPLISPKTLLAIDFSAVDDPAFQPTSAREFFDGLMPHRDSPGLAVIDKLTERLGADRLSIDLMYQGVANYTFSDRRDEFRVRSRGPRMERLVNEHGVEGLAEVLSTQFARLERDRAATLKAVDSLMARRGLQKDERTLDGRWYFGTDYRQLCFNPRTELTRRLRRKPPTEVLLEWSREQHVDPPVTPTEVEQAFLEHGPAIVQRGLPLDPPGHGPILGEFESLDLERLNQTADQFIAHFKERCESEGAERPIYTHDPLMRWGERNWYDRGRDTWADEAWWIVQARRVWKQFERICAEGTNEWVAFNDAALILMVNGDLTPKEKLIAHARRMECFDGEAFNDGLIWLLRDELPWTIDDEEMPVPPLVIGPRPVRWARRCAIAIREDLRADELLESAADLDPASAVAWLTCEHIGRMHELCLRWASSTDGEFTFWSEKEIRTAQTFGWTDVLDLMAKNPAVATGRIQRVGGMGAPSQGEFAQWLSLIKPGRYAARWAAHVMLMDVDAEVRAQHAAIIAGMKPWHSYDPPEAPAKLSDDFYWRQLREQQLAAAIAWHRCREAGFPP